MNQTIKIKKCMNCEADVNIQAIYCPFCGADLMLTNEQPIENIDNNISSSLNTESLSAVETSNLASLYKPPYSMRNKQGLGVPNYEEKFDVQNSDADQQDSQHHFHSDPQQTSFSSGSAEVHLDSNSEQSSSENMLKDGGHTVTLLLLMLGSQLCVFALLLLFCGRNGVLHLEWNSQLWFVYVLTSVPCLYFGFQGLKRLKE